VYPDAFASAPYFGYPYVSRVGYRAPWSYGPWNSYSGAGISAAYWQAPWYFWGTQVAVSSASDSNWRTPDAPDVAEETRFAAARRNDAGNDGLAGKDDGDWEQGSSRRGTNSDSLARARRFLAFGDFRFVRKQYRDALQRYQEASQTAPAMAEAHLRQGFALIATRRYVQAAQSIRRGVSLDPAWAHSGFRLELIYGENLADKTSHIEALASTAEKEPSNGDLMLLIGVFLYYDGQENRAVPFLERAAQLAAVDYARVRSLVQAAASDDR
jgi:tetratricopeptide (TPR) repeat protein